MYMYMHHTTRKFEGGETTMRGEGGSPSWPYVEKKTPILYIAYTFALQEFEGGIYWDDLVESSNIKQDFEGSGILRHGEISWKYGTLCLKCKPIMISSFASFSGTCLNFLKDGNCFIYTLEHKVSNISSL